MSIPRAPEPEVDGNSGDWTGSTATILMAPGLAGDERLRSNGDFGADDLRVETSWSWSEGGLHAIVRWRDDQVDTAVVRSENQSWPAPDGSGDLDRMYLWDNLVVRLASHGDADAADFFFYGIWLAPRARGASPYQWDVLRQGPRTEPRRVQEVHATRAASRRLAAGEIVVEAVISWERLGLRPRAGDTYGLRLIASDSDCAGRTLEQKYSEGCMKRLAWIGEIELRD